MGFKSKELIEVGSVGEWRAFGWRLPSELNSASENAAVVIPRANAIKMAKHILDNWHVSRDTQDRLLEEPGEIMMCYSYLHSIFPIQRVRMHGHFEAIAVQYLTEKPHRFCDCQGRQCVA